MLKASALLAVLLLGVQDTGEQFYRFAKGSTWKYTATTPDSKDRATIEVIGEDGGKVSSSMVMTGERGHKSELRWWVEDGILYWGEKRGEKLVEVMGLYKVGSKKGDTWKLEAKEGRVGQEGSHQGLVELKVPAGVYKDAVHVRVKMLDDVFKASIDFYLAEKVGLVKIAYNHDDKVSELLLEEYRPAK